MITIIANNELTSGIRVHAAGCPETTSPEIHFVKKFMGTMSVEDYGSEEQAAIDFFGEVAADNFEWGTDEWLDEVMREWKVAAHIFPCVK